MYGLISKKGYGYRGHTIVEYGKDTQFDFNKENEWDYFEALNNLDALSDMTDEVERTYFEQDKAYIHHIGELPSYSSMNYAIAEQGRIFEYEQAEVDDSVEGVVLEEANENDTENAVTTYVNHDVYENTFREDGTADNTKSIVNELTGVDLLALYDQGNKRISEVLDTLEDLTADERQTYLNEFAQQMARDNVNTQDKLEEALRKFICNL